MTQKEFQEPNIIEKLAVKTKTLIGTPGSFLVHTIFFVGSFGLVALGVDSEVEENIEDIQKDVDKIEGGVDSISQDIEELEDEEETESRRTQETLNRIELALNGLRKEIENLKSNSPS